MPALPKWARFGWWAYMVRPKTSFRTFFDAETGGFNLLLIFLFGILIVQIWGDIFNLGSEYMVGKLMTVSLILGPLAGLLWVTFAAFMMYLAGKLLGLEKDLEKNAPPLKEGEKPMIVTFKALFLGICKSKGPVFCGGIALWLEIVFFDGAHFSEGFGSGPAGLWIFLLLKCVFFAWFLYLLILMLQAAYRTSLMRAAIAWAISLPVASAIVMLILFGVFNVPLF